MCVLQAAMLSIMPFAHPNDPRLDPARELIRERGLSQQELRELEAALGLLGAAQFPLLAVEPARASAEPVQRRGCARRSGCSWCS